MQICDCVHIPQQISVVRSNFMWLEHGIIEELKKPVLGLLEVVELSMTT